MHAYLGHKPFKSGQAFFFQNDDKNDKTHRAQNVYLSRPIDATQNAQLSRRET